jgi:hypothetical protein
VLVTVPPGDIDPQSMVVMGTVHALSEYTPKPGDAAIDPEVVMLLFTLIAA